MRRVAAACTLLVALAAASGAGADPLRYGVADDWPKWHACGDLWWQATKDIGLQDLRMTVQWDERQPATIPDEDSLAAAVDCAVASGVRPILAIYPRHPAAIGSNAAAQAQFAAFVAHVGAAFPTVTNFIVGNEPNVNRFWQPQYVGGRDAAAREYEHTLAASYDALKAVRSNAFVWGPAISSRGNDNPYAFSDPSHSPVWFIKNLGDAYRASGRTTPIFDTFDMHPYPPVQDTAAFSTPFHWPQAGAADVDRIKQALWDAFHDTAQPVPAEYGGSRSPALGLPIAFDEAGEQTTVNGHDPAYVHPVESVRPISEATQAARYVDLARRAACDPDIETVLWFPLVDDAGLADGFQSGVLYADLARKQSYGALKRAIASDGGLCAGLPHRWVHTTSVVGAAARFAGPRTALGSEPARKPGGLRQLVISVTAAEDATFVASVVPGSLGREAAAARGLAAASGTLQAYRTPPIALRGRIPDGRYRIRVVVTARTNPERSTTLTSRPFSVGGRARR